MGCCCCCCGENVDYEAQFKEQKEPLINNQNRDQNEYSFYGITSIKNYDENTQTLPLSITIDKKVTKIRTSTVIQTYNIPYYIKYQNSIQNIVNILMEGYINQIMQKQENNSDNNIEYESKYSDDDIDSNEEIKYDIDIIRPVNTDMNQCNLYEIPKIIRDLCAQYYGSKVSIYGIVKRLKKFGRINVDACDSIKSVYTSAINSVCIIDVRNNIFTYGGMNDISNKFEIMPYFKENNITDIDFISHGISGSCTIFMNKGNHKMYGYGKCEPYFDETKENIPVILDTKIFTGKITKISVGSSHLIFLDDNGKVWVAGNNIKGQCGAGTFSKKIEKPKRIGSLTDIIDIECGDEYTICINNKYALFGFGCNEFGQIGDGHMSVGTNIYFPTKMSTFATSEVNIIKVKCGKRHTMAIDELGKLYAFGYNKHGQLGIGAYIEDRKMTVHTPVCLQMYNKLIKDGFFMPQCVHGI